MGKQKIKKEQDSEVWLRVAQTGLLPVARENVSVFRNPHPFLFPALFKS